MKTTSKKEKRQEMTTIMRNGVLLSIGKSTTKRTKFCGNKIRVIFTPPRLFELVTFMGHDTTKSILNEALRAICIRASCEATNEFGEFSNEKYFDKIHEKLKNY